MATGSTPHRISRRLRLGFCDSPHDGVIARERGRPARILSPHFSPGCAIMAPEFSPQCVLASEGRSGDYVRASMCALRGKGQARARPAQSVVAGPLNGTNQGAENKPLFTTHSATW